MTVLLKKERLKKYILLFVGSVIFLCAIFFIVYNNTRNNIRQENKININKSAPTVVNLNNEKSKIVSKISVSEDILGITINGMSNKPHMEEILNLLDDYSIKATFFLPGNRVAEEPDIAEEIINRGHGVGNYTLNQKKNFEELSIEEMKKEFSKTNEILEKRVGIVPQYFRCSNSKYSDQVLQVAANCELSIAVPDFIKVNSSKIKTEEEAKKYVSDLKGGNILSINLESDNDIVKGMSLLFKEIKEKKYEVLSIEELAYKDKLLYSTSYEEMTKILNDNKKIHNKDSKAIKSNDYELINLEKSKVLNDQLKYKNTIDTKALEKGNEKNSDVSYEVLYNNPIKGSGKVFSYGYTTSKSVALTFDGLGNKEMIYGILDALDKSNIKATFFLPGSKVKKNPELALEILKRGHEIENNTLSGKAMNTVDYENACKEIGESSKIIEEKLGIKTKYVRPRFGKYGKDFMIAALNTGNEVVTYSKNPLDMDMKSAEDIASYIKKEIRRGEIILLNADTNPEVIKAIPMISNIVRDIGYDFVTVDKLYKSQYNRLKLEAIQGYDEIKINNQLSNTVPKTISNINDIEKNVGKTIALTFDDWGTDKAVTSILGNLEKYNIKATFFIRSNGVVNNPNLAKAISEGGHDVASHTFSHLVINDTDKATLQNDLVKGHQALTYAIQRKPEMFFRPPQLEISDESLKIVGATGYKNIIVADLSTHDWDSKLSKEEVVNDVLTNASSGSIVVLHLLDDAQGWKALPDIIEGLQKKGFSFVKLSEYIN